jgi:outer membrane protein
VYINGDPVQFEIENNIPITSRNPYFDQVNENFGQSFGASLRIPILNNFSTRIAIQRSQVDVLNTEVRSEQARQQLKTNIQTAIANARNGRRSYDAALRAVEANQIAFQNAQRRFDLGATNSLEYTTARNNLDQAQISLIQAKYQYLFNVKSVEFYQGKQIKLD